MNSKGDLAEARRLCRRLLEITNDSSSDAWMNLGLVEFYEGHFDQAVDCLRRAYAIGEEQTDDLFLHVSAPTVLAMHPGRHRPRRAVRLVEQAFDRARAARWPTGLAIAHYAAGLASFDTDPAASLERVQPCGRDRSRGRQPAGRGDSAERS